jgi:sugar phosphate isomerase/epimerase
MRLGVCAQALHHLQFADGVQRARDLGFHAMELPVHAGNPWVDLAAMLEGRPEDVLLPFRAAGLDISALSNHTEGQLLLGPDGVDTDHVFQGDAAAKSEFARNRLILTAELARRLDVGVVCGFTGCEDYSRWFPYPLADGYERMVPAFRERLLPVLDAFEQRGVRFAIECHPKQFAYNLETAQLALAAVDHHPALAFNLDPANLLIAGTDPVVFVAELGDRIAHVHAKDGESVAHNAGRSGLLAHGAWGRRDRGFRFRIPGWGDVPWRRLLTELQLAGYDGVIALEHEDPTFSPMEGLERGAEFLEPLLFRDPKPDRSWW